MAVFVHRPCLFPLVGYMKNYPDGTRKFKMSADDFSMQDCEHATHSCGKCFNCLMNKRMDWTLRLFHESFYWEYTYFCTLTFDDDNIGDNELSIRVAQLFMKRLRKFHKDQFKYFLCGEYGSKSGRAHYHFLLYTSKPLTLQFLKRSRCHNYYTCKELGKAWTYGFNIVSDMNLSTIRYTAGYILKKLGKVTDYHKQREFILCSRKPGIGQQYIKEHYKTALINGFCTVSGKPYSIPKYYYDYVKLTDPEFYAKILSEQPERGQYPAVATVGCQNAVKRKQKLLSISADNL